MIRDFLKHRFGFYDLEELTTEACCGLCGRSMQDVVPRDWPWSLCNLCAGKVDEGVAAIKKDQASTGLPFFKIPGILE